MGMKTYSRSQLPPCPDPHSYLLVHIKEGYYWRKKRGSIKKATLNKVLARNNATAKITAPASSRILRMLEPYTLGMKLGRLPLSISAKLMKTYHAKGVIDFSGLLKMEINPANPLDKLLQSQYKVEQKKKYTSLQLPGVSVKPQNNLVTDYYFEAILLYGNPTTDKGLKIKSTSSNLFSFAGKMAAACELRLPQPPALACWMLLLKISCLEGNEYAAHPKHYAMKVVETGG